MKCPEFLVYEILTIFTVLFFGSHPKYHWHKETVRHESHSWILAPVTQASNLPSRITELQVSDYAQHIRESSTGLRLLLVRCMYTAQQIGYGERGEHQGTHCCNPRIVNIYVTGNTWGGKQTCHQVEFISA